MAGGRGKNGFGGECGVVIVSEFGVRGLRGCIWGRFGDLLLRLNDAVGMTTTGSEEEEEKGEGAQGLEGMGSVFDIHV